MIPLGRPRHRCEKNIKVDLAEIGSDGVGWAYMSQNMDH